MPIKQIPLIGNQGIYQDNDNDGILADYPYFFNCYFEDTGNKTSPVREYSMVKRPGLASSIKTLTSANHKIVAMCANQNRTVLSIYSIGGGTNNTWLYDSSSNTLTSLGVAPAAAGAWTQTLGVCYTVLDVNAYSGYQWVVTDMTKGAVVPPGASAWTEITDADFTGLTKKTNFAALDGYIFIGEDRNRIYNSDLNVPTSWAATSFISANDFPGKLMWLMKLRNYLVAFKENSIEFFEDVGNPTPGSPLESRKQLNRGIGLLHRNTVQEVADGIIFAGTTRMGGNKLYKINKTDMSIKEVSTRYVEQCLNTLIDSGTYTQDQVLSGALKGQSQVFSLGGKDFYSICLNEPLSLPITATMQVYDNDLNVWTTWASSVSSSGVVDTAGFSGSNCVMLYRNATNSLCAIFADNVSATARLLAMDMQASNWYDLSPSSSQNTYTVAWTSDIIDFGSRGRKFLDSLEVLYDIDSTSSPSSSGISGLTLKYRDVGYNANSGWVGTRNLLVDPGGWVRAVATQLGSFRRRVFTLQYAVNTALRIWGIEVNYNEGETNQES